MSDQDLPEPKARGTPAEVFWAFLKLGLTAFGGPVAHLGYFREAFVRRRKWLDEAAYADLVALCQFLPGPASSQVGFGLGLRRAGALGALAAWVGFTLPSAVLMILFAYGVGFMTGTWALAVIHGLKLVAVAVVAQAVWGMARTLTPDARRIAIGALAFGLVTFIPGAVGQVGAIVLGGLAGLAVCRQGLEAPQRVHHPAMVSKRVGLFALAVFFVLLLGTPILATATHDPAIARFDAFYRAGALVFGGGHVILPLLKQGFVDTGWVGPDTFLAGYGAAQALPGPLSTFAAFLGAALRGQPNGLFGAGLGVVGIFLPGMLTLVAALPFWSALQKRPNMRAAMRGANASVVGVLAAALYSPVWTSSVHDLSDVAIAGCGFVLLAAVRAPPILVVALGAVTGALRVVLAI